MGDPLIVTIEGADFTCLAAESVLLAMDCQGYKDILIDCEGSIHSLKYYSELRNV